MLSIFIIKCTPNVIFLIFSQPNGIHSVLQPARLGINSILVISRALSSLHKAIKYQGLMLCQKNLKQSQALSGNCLSSGCYNEILQTGWLRPQMFLSQFCRPGSPRWRCWQVQCPMRALFLACRWLASHCILTWQRERGEFLLQSTGDEGFNTGIFSGTHMQSTVAVAVSVTPSAFRGCCQALQSWPSHASMSLTIGSLWGTLASVLLLGETVPRLSRPSPVIPQPRNALGKISSLGIHHS